MNVQTELLFPSSGRINAQKGINKAVESANNKHPKWADRAYRFLLDYIRGNKAGHCFMVEQVRDLAKGVIPDPPSDRAWGGIVRNAVKNDLITRNGYRQVKNPNANMANASEWRIL